MRSDIENARSACGREPTRNTYRSVFTNWYSSRRRTPLPQTREDSRCGRAAEEYRIGRVERRASSSCPASRSPIAPRLLIARQSAFYEPQLSRIGGLFCFCGQVSDNATHRAAWLANLSNGRNTTEWNRLAEPDFPGVIRSASLGGSCGDPVAGACVVAKRAPLGMLSGPEYPPAALQSNSRQCSIDEI
jgi:hypothetical protein